MHMIGVIANVRKPRAGEVIERLVKRAERLGMRVMGDPATARLAPNIVGMEMDELCSRSEALLALGGDGTMLRVVREMGAYDVPVMGVNLGSLGFLTSIAESDLEEALDCLSTGKMRLGRWATAEAVVLSCGCEVGHYRALNDIVVRSGSSRVATLDVSVDGDSVTPYVCDGVIVSTPAGSTGYSLAAAGPILTPGTEAFVISPICPHTLSSRPLVVPDRSEVVIAAGETGGALFLTVDGQVGQSLARGDCVRIRRSERDVRFLHKPGYSYFDVLRRKLGWSGAVRGATPGSAG